MVAIGSQIVIIMVDNHNEEHWCCMVFFDLFCVFFGTGEK